MTKFFQIIGWSRLSRTKLFLVLSFTVAVVSVACIHYYFRSHPEGVYYDAYSDVGGDWTFENGKVISRSLFGRQEIGSYSWDMDSWIINVKYTEYRMRSSMFGVSLVDTGRYHEQVRKFYPRWWFHNVRAFAYWGLHIHLLDDGGYP